MMFPPPNVSMQVAEKLSSNMGIPVTQVLGHCHGITSLATGEPIKAMHSCYRGLETVFIGAKLSASLGPAR